MVYNFIYKTSDLFDNILITVCDEYLTGLSFTASSFVFDEVNEKPKAILDVCKWLDMYFKGETPDFDLKYKLDGLTDFTKEVLNIVLNIPFGKRMSYLDIANIIGKKRGKLMSSQAVGRAIGLNPICIVIPCHRVVRSNGTLGGYNGGLANKKALLEHEDKYFNVLKRCEWCNLDNSLYVKYHDEEWGVCNFDERYLFEMLILESFQAGLSWECILNKREAFKKAYDNFDIDMVVNYGDRKIRKLLTNDKIVRNKLKIYASINNAIIFKNIQKEFGSFSLYLKHFTNGKIIYETGKVRNELSDRISNDLKKRGMKFVGSLIIYAYLQAIGVIYSHDEGCFLCHYKEELKY